MTFSIKDKIKKTEYFSKIQMPTKSAYRFDKFSIAIVVELTRCEVVGKASVDFNASNLNGLPVVTPDYPSGMLYQNRCRINPAIADYDLPSTSTLRHRDYILANRDVQTFVSERHTTA